MNQRKRKKRANRAKRALPNQTKFGTGPLRQIESVGETQSQLRLTVERIAPLLDWAKYENAPKTRRRRMIMTWAPIIVGAAALVIAVWSLWVSFEMSTRDDLASRFARTIESRVNVALEDGQLRARPSVVAHNVVITNNGRLPITIVEISTYPASSTSTFCWISLGQEVTSQDTPIELNVGEAIAVQVAVPGATIGTQIEVVTSDGKRRVLPADGGETQPQPAPIAAAFDHLGSCKLP